MSQPGGTIYHRGGNGSGWNTGNAENPIYWRALLDNYNYKSYITTSDFPGLNKVGTVTSITAGTGLTGGTITTSGTIALAASGAQTGSYGPSSNVTGSNGATMSVPYITVDTYGRITAASNKTYTAKNYYPSRSYSSGLQISTTNDSTNYAAGALYVPNATASQSGVVTTAAQTFAGAKTFNTHLTMNSTSRIKFGGESNYIYGGTSYLQINGASSIYFSLGGTDKLKLTDSALHPTSSQGLTLGTIS